MESSEIQDLNESRSLIGKNDDSSESGAAEEDDIGNEAPSISIDDLDTVDQLLEHHKNTPRLWTSIYSNFGKINMDESEIGHYGEPRFTDYASQFQGTLDYMFYEKDAKISIKRILMLPKEEFLKPSLPNKNFGSDHLCLVADIEF